MSGNGCAMESSTAKRTPPLEDDAGGCKRFKEGKALEGDRHEVVGLQTALDWAGKDLLYPSGPVQSIDVLANCFSHSANHKRKIAEIKRHGYEHMRRIRGDGNCFYRALGLAWLEELTARAEAGRPVDKLNFPWPDSSRFGDLVPEYSQLRQAVEGLLVVGPDPGFHGRMLLARLMSDLRLDLCFVSFVRILVADFLRTDAEDENALLVKEAVAAERGGLDDFINSVVLPMGLEAEGAIINVAARQLAVHVKIVQLDGTPGPIVQYDYNLESLDSPSPLRACLLFRPGHYELLYDNAGARAANVREKSLLHARCSFCWEWADMRHDTLLGCFHRLCPDCAAQTSTCPTCVEVLPIAWQLPAQTPRVQSARRKPSNRRKASVQPTAATPSASSASGAATGSARKMSSFEAESTGSRASEKPQPMFDETATLAVKKDEDTACGVDASTDSRLVDQPTARTDSSRSSSATTAGGAHSQANSILEAAKPEHRGGIHAGSVVMQPFRRLRRVSASGVSSQAQQDGANAPADVGSSTVQPSSQSRQSADALAMPHATEESSCQHRSPKQRRGFGQLEGKIGECIQQQNTHASGSSTSSTRLAQCPSQVREQVKSVGKAGASRRRTVIRENIQDIPTPALRALARHGGCKPFRDVVPKAVAPSTTQEAAAATTAQTSQGAHDTDLALAAHLQKEEEAAAKQRAEPRTAATVDASLAVSADARASEGLEGVASMECGICFESCPLESIFFVPCRGNHVFCLECTYRHVRTEILEHGRRPRCPLAGQETSDSGSHVGGGGATEDSRPLCSYIFTQPDVEDAVRPAIDSMERQKEAVRIVDVLGALELPGAVAGAGCVRCPGCGGWLQLEDDEPMADSDRGRHVVCPGCSCSFCSKCERQPHHFRGSCSDQPLLHELFAWWRREGREVYMQGAADSAERYYSEWLHYRTQRALYQEQAAEAERRSEELRRDEKWKALHCRLCPNCSRPIQKIKGCDSMTCGSDGHVGNAQPGCGHSFSWNKAPKYKAQEVVAPELEPKLKEMAAAVRAARPQSARRRRTDAGNGAKLAAVTPATWLDEAGEPVRCNICKGALRGPRFDCVHCPNFVCCVRCEKMVSAGVYSCHPFSWHVFEIRLAPPTAPEAAPGVAASVLPDAGFETQDARSASSDATVPADRGLTASCEAREVGVAPSPCDAAIDPANGDTPAAGRHQAQNASTASIENNAPADSCTTATTQPP